MFQGGVPVNGHTLPDGYCSTQLALLNSVAFHAFTMYRSTSTAKAKVFPPTTGIQMFACDSTLPNMVLHSSTLKHTYDHATSGMFCGIEPLVLATQRLEHCWVSYLQVGLMILLK